MKDKTPEHYLFSNKQLALLLIPLIAEQLLTVLVGLADSIMVASVSEAAVSAVSLIDTIMILLINIFGALATGGAIVTGQAIGRREPEEGCKITDQIFFICTAFSSVIMILVYLCKPFILNVVFGDLEADVYSNCNTYLLIVTASVPFIAMYNASAAVHRSMSDSKTPLMISIVMNVINVAGNAFCIFGLGMGIEGAAIPTLISRVLGGVWMVALLTDKKKPLHIKSLRKIRPNLHIIKKILYLGVPFGLENGMFQLGKILVISLVASFGTASIAANAVANNVSVFAIIIGLSVSYAMSAVIAQCVGAGDYQQVRYYTKKLLKISYAGIIIMNAIIVAILPLIIKIYSLSPETGELAAQIIVYHAVCAILIWPLSFNLTSTLRASNDVGFCMWTSIGSMWIFRIGFSFVLAKFFHLGLMGVWIAMTIDWLARSILLVSRYRGTKWQMNI